MLTIHKKIDQDSHKCDYSGMVYYQRCDYYKG